MSKDSPPFDPQAFAQWLVDGLKETVSYRLKQTFDKEKLIDFLRAKVPNKNEVVHFALKKVFEQSGFVFEDLNQGDARFHVIRKKFREIKPGQPTRRLLLVPGLGDTPASWMPAFALSRNDLKKRFDEVLVIDFPGYMGFLSSHAMVPSMEILLNVVKMVCQKYPPTVMVGHSLGGWLAGKIAQSPIAFLEHLILIAPSGLIPLTERVNFGDSIVNHQALPIDELMSKIIHEPKKYHELLREDLKAFYSKPEIKKFVQSVTEDQFIDPTLAFQAKKITVLWGEKDQFVPSQWIRYWVEHYGAYLDAYILMETGHIPQLERPIATAEVVMHAILGKPSKTGSHWKKIQSRRMEGTKELPTPNETSQRLLAQ